MLVELLRPAGVERARRWVSALLMVPEGERDEVIAAVTRRIEETYGSPDPPPPGAPADADDELLHVADEPTAGPGYVEQTIRSYGRPAASAEGEDLEAELEEEEEEEERAARARAAAEGAGPGRGGKARRKGSGGGG